MMISISLSEGCLRMLLMAISMTSMEGWDLMGLVVMMMTSSSGDICSCISFIMLVFIMSKSIIEVVLFIIEVYVRLE